MLSAWERTQLEEGWEAGSSCERCGALLNIVLNVVLVSYQGAGTMKPHFFFSGVSVLLQHGAELCDAPNEMCVAKGGSI